MAKKDVCSTCGTVHDQNPDCASMCNRYTNIQLFMAHVPMDAKIEAKESMQRTLRGKNG